VSSSSGKNETRCRWSCSLVWGLPRPVGNLGLPADIISVIGGLRGPLGIPRQPLVGRRQVPLSLLYINKPLGKCCACGKKIQKPT